MNKNSICKTSDSIVALKRPYRDGYGDATLYIYKTGDKLKDFITCLYDNKHRNSSEQRFIIILASDSARAIKDIELIDHVNLLNHVTADLPIVSGNISLYCRNKDSIVGLKLRTIDMKIHDDTIIISAPVFDSCGNNIKDYRNEITIDLYDCGVNSIIIANYTGNDEDDFVAYPSSETLDTKSAYMWETSYADPVDEDQLF